MAHGGASSSCSRARKVTPEKIVSVPLHRNDAAPGHRPFRMTNATEYGLYCGCAYRCAGEGAGPRPSHGRGAAGQRLGPQDRHRAHRAWMCRDVVVRLLRNLAGSAHTILFRTDLADEIAVRRKRAGHLLGRVAISQLNCWRCSTAISRRTCCKRGGAVARRSGADKLLRLSGRGRTTFPQGIGRGKARMRGLGFDFYDWGPGEIRLVTPDEMEASYRPRVAIS